MFIILKNGYFQLWILYNSDLRNSTAEENIYELSKLTMFKPRKPTISEWVHYVNLHLVHIHLVNFTFGQPYIWSITTFGHFTFRPFYISSIDTIRQL